MKKEEERCPEVEMMVRMREEKKVNKLVTRCFYQSNRIRRGCQKQIIATWREIGTSEITEQRLFDQARVIRINRWITEVELEEIRRKILTPKDSQ